jgi:phage terminase large subunit GpA-like protein
MNRPAAKPQPELIERESARRRALREAHRIAKRHLRPPPRLSVSEWADRHRILPDTSAAPGRWRTERAPYLREIMDTCGDLEVERVVLQKAAQVGYSELLLNVLGYFIDQDPAPILLVQISTGEAEKFSKERVAPLIAETACLRDKVAPSKSRDSENTIESKAFPGGHLGIVGANAPSGLRSRPRRVILFDEVDGYPPSAGDEGDPIELATKRTTTFWNAFVLMGSTPTLKDLSRIEDALEECDEVRRYHVPCPHCGAFQVLRFELLTWEKEERPDGSRRHRPETAAYRCESCAALIEERYRLRMLASARWVADEPAESKPRRVGFHISALYPIWVRWERLAREFLDAVGNPEKLQVFVNTRLGETWDEKGQTVDVGPLFRRREPYPAEPLPDRVVLLTAGVDVQHDRLEVEIVGWAPGEESWSIEYLRLPGDPSVGALWRDLDHVLLQRAWQHPRGARMRIGAAAVDSQYMTSEVLKYCAVRVAARIWPIHGVAGMGKPIMDRPTDRNKFRVANFPVGTDTAKGVIYARLLIDDPPEPGAPTPGYCHFPERAPYDEEHFRQLTAEKVVIRKSRRGHLVREWVRRPGRRAEVLDTRVYATAALEGLLAAGVRLEQLAKNLAGTAAPAPKRRVRHPGQQV